MEMFDMWMKQNHPYYYLIMGVIVLLLIATILISLILPFFNVYWWWKLTLLSIALLCVHRLVLKIVNLRFYDKFESGEDKIKMK